MNVLRTFFVDFSLTKIFQTKPKSLGFIRVRLVSAKKRLKGVKNHNRMQAQRSLRQKAEKGIRLKGDTTCCSALQAAADRRRVP